MSIHISHNYAYNYIDSLHEQFKNDSHNYVKRYLNRYLEQRMSILSIEARKEAFYMLSKIDSLELKYLRYVSKYISSRFTFMKKIYQSFCTTILEEYMKALQAFLQFTNICKTTIESGVWDFICTLINIIWQKRFQIILDTAHPGKYVVDKNYKPILIN